MARQFGLIGFPLGHSFSKKYFTEKFEKLGLTDHFYDLYELETIDEFEKLIISKEIAGLNVTIPYKQDIIAYLDKLDTSAEKVGAVNVIKNENGILTGYNSDYPAFRESLKNWLVDTNIKALVLGTGGASKAVIGSLDDLNIDYKLVSRIATVDALSYEQVFLDPEIVKEYKLIINATPLGMSPNTYTSPNLPYDKLTSSHYLYDLVYNPERTAFLLKGEEQGCKTKNGLEMLHTQAEIAWEIWNA